MDKPTSNELDRLDHLELKEIDARAARIEAQIETAVLRHAELVRQRDQVAGDMRVISARLMADYNLTPADKVDVQSGVLTREAPPPTGLKAV